MKRDPENDMSAPTSPDAEDATLGALLRAAGKREAPPADFARELRAALQDEWQAGVEQRRQRRRAWQFGGAAAAAVAVMGVAVSLWLATPDDIAVARIVQVEGDAVSPTAAISDLLPGARVATGAGSRVALVLAGGVAVRLDEDTEVRVDRADSLAVSRGAVYIDADTKGASAPLQVQTPYGSVRHLGTQYEVRLLDDALSVSVREGRIALDRDDASLQGSAGERLLVSSAGNVQRGRIATDAPAWDWIAGVTPPFEIDNRPLPEFLAWAGRELGREVVFATPAAEAQAGQVVLRGSVAGLTPDQAVDAVLVSTTLRAERGPGRLTIRE